MHGKDILNSVLPVGMLGEEGSEAQNKFYRNFRLSHARKTSSEDNLKDTFFRVLDASDPIVSNISLEERMCKMMRLPIPEEVRDLFATLAVPQLQQSTLEDDDTPDDSGFQETIIHLDTLQLASEPDQD